MFGWVEVADGEDLFPIDYSVTRGEEDEGGNVSEKMFD